MRAAGSEEPGSEGLPSTSLLDLLLPTGLEPLDSEEPSEAVGLGAGLGAPGSGFPSEESEESRILQPPQYFWEEEDALNESSLGLGPTAGSVLTRPCVSEAPSGHTLACWLLVAVLRPPPVGAQPSRVSDRSMPSAGSWHGGSAAVGAGLWRVASEASPSACGVLSGQGWNPCLPHWQVDSEPLAHQGRPCLWRHVLMAAERPGTMPDSPCLTHAPPLLCPHLLSASAALRNLRLGLWTLRALLAQETPFPFVIFTAV